MKHSITFWIVFIDYGEGLKEQFNLYHQFAVHHFNYMLRLECVYPFEIKRMTRRASTFTSEELDERTKQCEAYENSQILWYETREKCCMDAYHGRLQKTNDT